jgi:AraC family transcriptional regulator
MPRMLDRAAGRHARHEFAGSGYVLGRFRCPAGDARWDGLDWIGEWPHVVLPETPVRIGPPDGRAELRTVNEVVVYEGDTHYRRVAVSTDGDRCAFIAVEPALADELDLASGRPGVRHAPADPRAFLGLHRARAALAGSDPDLLAVDEALLAVIGHAARRTGRTSGDARTDSRTVVVATVREILASAPARRWTLAELGAAVHYSPYCLARMFRRHTGSTIAAYRRQLCLRASLPRALRPGADLARIAVDHGFSRHSHYTAAFRKHFGCTPSRARDTSLRC